ncbi:MAG TPA: hypothetical protein VLD39_01260, partial [Gammaproteobacteria bacterium]|nr:hypothetical protein [Gammaproteobacteria bacterium]
MPVHVAQLVGLAVGVNRRAAQRAGFSRIELAPIRGERDEAFVLPQALFALTDQRTARGFHLFEPFRLGLELGDFGANLLEALVRLIAGRFVLAYASQQVLGLAEGLCPGRRPFQLLSP